MMQTFEYVRVHRILDVEYAEDELALLTCFGSDGWELTAVVERRPKGTLTYIFKRAVTPH